MYRIAAGSVGFGISAIALWKSKSFFNGEEFKIQGLIAAVDKSDLPYEKPLPSRNVLLQSLKNADNHYDVLVIGGGATGCGVALDACSRGLKTALVERNDYSSGASSRSTKLIHGGVRYLQQAILKFDKEQYDLVKEALHERSVLLSIAPHIATPLPILLPVYKWWQVPYFWVGIKMYDLVAGRQLVRSSYFLGKKKILEIFPMLKSESICGGIVYYDGQQDDSRMNLTIALTALRNGATCVNHVEVKELIFDEVKNENGANKIVSGARVCDKLTGEEWTIKAKCVVNATGPFTDAIRRMDDKTATDICQPASGVHITLPKYYCSQSMGLLDPATSDGRVIFVLPWEGKTIAGTTDRKCEVTEYPEPSEDEIQFILNELKKWFNEDMQVRREDVLSAWSGIRPLVLDPSSKDTKSISRNHVVNVSETNLVTIAGGKWTTYRAMAKDAIDAGVNSCQLQPQLKSATDSMLLEGAVGWTPTSFVKLSRDYGLDTEVAEHLSHTYGAKARQVADLASTTGKRYPQKGLRLTDEFPFIEAEILYAIRQEYACTAVDMIARRLRLTFLDTAAATEVLPKVVDIMGKELHWDRKRMETELEEAKTFIGTMTGKPKENS